jgi:hypothetical protein
MACNTTILSRMCLSPLHALTAAPHSCSRVFHLSSFLLLFCCLPCLSCPQVVPTQGFPVRSGAVYTVRLAIANSLTSSFDSQILIPFKSLALAAPGTAVAGGPYTAVSRRVQTRAERASGVQQMLQPGVDTATRMVTSMAGTRSHPRHAHTHVGREVWHVTHMHVVL